TADVFRSARIRRLHADPRGRLLRARRPVPLAARRRAHAGGGRMTRGVSQIVRFNWPFYAAALAVAAIAAWIPLLRPLAALAIFWPGGSLVVSWLVYAGSRLSRWTWAADPLGFRPRAWINLHAGLDESTPALRRVLPRGGDRAFDFYDAREMNEP